MADREKEPLKPLSEEEIQHRLYGDIIGKLEPIKREVAETKKKVYHLKESRRALRFKNTFKFAISAAIFVLIILAFANGARRFGNIKNNISTKSARFSTGTRYTIQAAVYKNKRDAESFSRALTARGYYPCFVKLYYTKSGAAMYKVCVGRIDDKKEAKSLLRRLRKEVGAGDSFLINLPAR